MALESTSQEGLTNSFFQGFRGNFQEHRTKARQILHYTTHLSLSLDFKLFEGRWDVLFSASPLPSSFQETLVNLVKVKL